MVQPILIVEDDPDGQVLISHVIGYMDIPHDVVGDAEEATRKLFASDTIYQAVIIDLQLPGKDGFELLADIRNNLISEDLMCIAVTAFHTSETRKQALQAGFNAYFSKPMDATHFARELETLL